ncbi:MarR family winged helix-turn-helix transcriptional regulator [Roseomonas sp. HF4]|uniref:MarR family winged helix-turn-helix transcriptional regulator n=1 Tax=Roseomonas sp. HF4 TaxID=2562313 RepID=UPI0010C0E571|nr:MarR family transcriptional regulator [Roseomonas sp. HF4]
MPTSNTETLPAATVHHIRDTCLCLATQRAARALARRFDAALRPFGLTHGQFSLMVALNRPEPPPIGRLAPFLAMDASTLTAAVKPLERRGLLRIIADTQDRRSRRVQITPEGVSLLRDAIPAWQATHATLDAGLGHDAADALRQGLATVL